MTSNLVPGDLPEDSPSVGESLFLAVGKLRRAHGVHGEILMEILTDFPERIRLGNTLYVGDDHRPLRVRGRRKIQGGMLLLFDGYSSPEAVGALRNQTVFVPAASLPPLPEGEYYHHQIIGAQVITDEGQRLGLVTEILETGANDVAVVRPESGPEILIPLIASVLLSVDVERREVRVHLMSGILPESE